MGQIKQVKYVQWNPVTLVTNRPQISGGIDGVAILEGFFK